MTTVFCLHYLGGSAAEWAQVRTLLGEDLHVIPLDLPGFGAAARTPGYTVAEMVESIANSIRLAAPERWILVGHSMGAKVAAGISHSAEAGAKGLGGLVGLVLVAGSPPGPEPMDRAKREAMLQWFQGDMEARHSEAQGYLADNLAKPLPESLNQGAIRDVLRANRAAWVAWLQSGSREDWSSRVGVLRSPAMIIAGEQDGSLGAAAQRQFMQPHFVNSQLVVVPDAAHLLPLECPAEIARLILQHAHSVGAQRSS